MENLYVITISKGDIVLNAEHFIGRPSIKQIQMVVNNKGIPSMRYTDNQIACNIDSDASFYDCTTEVIYKFTLIATVRGNG